MQGLSNLLANVIMTYPLVYLWLLIRTYCNEATRMKEEKRLLQVTFYVLFVNHFFIDMGSGLEYYLIFYGMAFVPFCLVILKDLAGRYEIPLSLFGDRDILGLKAVKVFAMVGVWVLLLMGQYWLNSQSNGPVLQLNADHFNELQRSEDPVRTLMALAEDPATLLYDLEALMTVEPEDVTILFSGNWKKELQLVVEEASQINTYVLTYRRYHDRWRLEGLYDSRSQSKY